MKDKLKKLMSKINNFLFENPNIGVDRVLHFVVAAWFVSEFKIYGVFTMMLSFLFISFLVFFKEKYMDETFSIKDFLFSVVGGFTSIILYIPYDILFN